MRFFICSDIHVPFDWTASGGSEQYHISLCERLAAKGHQVTSYVPLPKNPGGDPVAVGDDVSRGSWFVNGVEWIDIKNLVESDNAKQQPGFWIMQRNPMLGPALGESRPDQVRAFACHDFDYGIVNWTKPYDVIFADSDIHARYLRLYHKANNVVVTGVGPDFDKRASLVPSVERNPKRIFWSSSYVRGLEYLFMIYERALEQVPDLELAISYGWESIDSSIAAGQNVAQLTRLKESMNATMARLPGIKHLGRLKSEVDVWTEFSKSGLWVYPSNWPETACQSIMEAQYFGAIPIYTPTWAVGENAIEGLRIDGDPYQDRLVRARFTQAIVDLVGDPDTESLRAPMMAEAKRRFGMDKVADRIESWALDHDRLPACSDCRAQQGIIESARDVFTLCEKHKTELSAELGVTA